MASPAALASVLDGQEASPRIFGVMPSAVMGQGDPSTGYYPTRYAVPGQPAASDRAAGVMASLLTAPARAIFGLGQGIGRTLDQANQAMPWGGNNPQAIGLDPQMGTMDPSVMVPFATDVAGMATTGSLAGPAVQGGVGMGIRAYHGSPHDFDRFSMDKIGTGEGAQAYGHGLYFAENRDIARAYRDALSPGETRIVSRSRDQALSGPEENAARLLMGFGNREDALAYLNDSVRGSATADPKWIAATEEAIKRLDPDDLQMAKDPSSGKMYEVSINASPDEFLDWDKPLSEQPESIRRALGWTPEAEAAYKKAQGSDTDALLAALEGDAIYSSAKMPVPEGVPPLSATGAEIMKGTSVFDNVAGANMSEKMRAAGIKGIRYKDAGSRGKEGDGTSNYVVFDDNIINILKKYGIAGLMAGGAGAAALGGSDPASASTPTYTTGGRF